MSDVKRRILVVDDEEASVEFVSSVVEEVGDVEVFTAGDGEEAVRKARAHLPALVVMDLNMPKKDGYTAYVELRGDPATAKIPVIMLSSMSAVGDYLTMNPAVRQPDFFLDKPVAPDKLLTIVRRLLN